MWIIMLLSIIPHSDVLTDTADVIEKNYVYQGLDEKKGIPTQSLCQWIFWEWSEKRQRYQVVHWVIVKKGDSLTSDSEGWQLRFQRDGKTRQINATSYRETHSMFDREIDDRTIWPVEKRRKLRNK